MKILIQYAALLFLLFMAPQYITQLPRAIMHDRGWSASKEDVLVALCFLYLIINGLP